MAKKDRERLQHRLDDCLSSIASHELTRQEVIDALRSAGCDVEQLRERLNQRARDLANAQRAKGRPAPEYLQEVIDHTEPPEALPRNPRRAIDKAKRWIQQFAHPPAMIGAVNIARAYRKDGELTKKDGELLDDIEAELRREMDNE
jgi:hypothetical protein